MGTGSIESNWFTFTVKAKSCLLANAHSGLMLRITTQLHRASQSDCVFPPGARAAVWPMVPRVGASGRFLVDRLPGYKQPLHHVAELFHFLRF